MLWEVPPSLEGAPNSLPRTTSESTHCGAGRRGEGLMSLTSPSSWEARFHFFK